MASAGPSSDLMAVLTSLPECARNCMLEANGTAPSALCAQQGPAIAEAVTKCIAAACTVREALATQNITLTSCGVLPNVDRTYIPISAVFMVLAFLAAAMRLANRFYAAGKWDGWDDWFLALALASCVGYNVISFEGAHRGLGADMWSVTPDNITHLFAGFYVGTLIYAVSRLFLRHSILLFYLRIFTIGNPRPVIIGTMAVNGLLSLTIAATAALQCRPISLFWNRWDDMHEGQCLPGTPVFLGGAIASMVMDVLVILLPLPYVARLQLSRKKRVGISMMLAIGISVVAFSILKSVAANNFENSPNPTVMFSKIALWSALEIDLGIICACLPGMRLLTSYCLVQWGWCPQKNRTDSRHQSRHLSAFHGNGTHNHLSGSIGWKPSTAGSGCSAKPPSSSSSSNSMYHDKIKITTTIHVHEKGVQSESQTYLPLGGDSAEMGDNRLPRGEVTAHAWA